MRSVLLALGSNLGDRAQNINKAIGLIKANLGQLKKTSHLYETDPFGVTKQPQFLNAVCQISSSLEASELLIKCKDIEMKLGRLAITDDSYIKWGPRTIDIDIAFYGNEIIKTPDLIVPHIGITEREFVLRPLCDIVPDFIHPVAKKPLSYLLRKLIHGDKEGDDIVERKSTCNQVLPVGRGRVLHLGKRTYIMGILNVTPDSFSDGGMFNSNVEASVHHAIAMENEGSDFIDIGGESTRPGSNRISESEELNRVIPVIEALRTALTKKETIISIDTTRAAVARAAVEAGADVINDISGGTYDDNMLKTVQSLGVPVILMHTRGTSKTMLKLTQYDNVVEDISRYLHQCVTRCVDIGIPQWMCVVDPGIGFAKTHSQTFTLLREIPALRKAVPGCPMLIGTSRKGFIGKAIDQPDASKRVHGTGATCAAAISGGADIIRVHDVAAMTDVAKISDKIWRV